ncbi:hypothetical protein ACQKQD_18225 [Methylobacterium sp. NPDC080182]|uniref:hypothetical protein n=1 Tax=Methylobacterium sp. NPDC080182 TaxID=3390590 RepID=UPI003D04FA77
MPSPKAIDAVAEAWASIDGKLDEYRRERDEDVGLTDEGCTGHFEGYQAEADELIRRIEARGFMLIPMVPFALSSPAPTEEG